MRILLAAAAALVLVTPALAAPLPAGPAAPDPRDAKIAALTLQVDRLTHLAIRFRAQRDALAAKSADGDALAAAQADVAAEQAKAAPPAAAAPAPKK